MTAGTTSNPHNTAAAPGGARLLVDDFAPASRGTVSVEFGCDFRPVLVRINGLLGRDERDDFLQSRRRKIAWMVRA